MSDVTTAFDAPYTEPVPGFGDVLFAYADCDYWAAWAGEIKTKRISLDKLKFGAIPVLDPYRRAAEERRIEEQLVYVDEPLDRAGTPEGLEKVLVDAIIRGGRTETEARAIRKRIGIGRQRQLARIVCSEPVPAVDQFRDAVRKACVARGMPAPEAAALTDADLIRLAGEVPPPQQADGDGADPLGSGGGPAADTPT